MVNVFLFIVSSLYLFLPAGFANMAPVFFRNINFLDSPVDFGKRYRGKRILGDHKTWRGFFFGVLVGVLVIFIQKQLFLDYPFFRSISLLDYSGSGAILVSVVLGFGALLGDAVESFFKRQAGFVSGESWVPFDQIDYVIGGLVLLFLVFRLSGWSVLAILGGYPILHIVFNHLGFYFGLRKDKW